MAKRKLSNSREAVRRRKAFFSFMVIFGVLVVAAVCVVLLISALSQVENVKTLRIEAMEYRKIEALPTQSELTEQRHLDEMKQIDKIFSQQGAQPIEEVIQTPYFVLFDSTDQKVLFSKDADVRAFPASTTKVLTAALVAKYADEETIFTAGDEQDMVSAGSSLANIQKGQQLDRDMVIDALMLPSGNDAAYLAAAVVGRIIADDKTLSAEKAVQVFVDEMNRTSESLGCKNTHFTCPDGFHDEEHYTSAMDLMRITVFSEDFPEVAASGAKTHRDLTYLTGEAISWSNSNKLITEGSGYYYPYATGLKTGMTEKSGFCIIASAERFGHELVIVSLGCDDSNVRYNECIALFDEGFAYIKAQQESESAEAPDAEVPDSETEDETDAEEAPAME